MAAKIGVYNISWRDMGVPTLEKMMDIVQVRSLQQQQAAVDALCVVPDEAGQLRRDLANEHRSSSSSSRTPRCMIVTAGRRWRGQQLQCTSTAQRLWQVCVCLRVALPTVLLPCCVAMLHSCVQIMHYTTSVECRKVAVHCHAGLGRTGLAIACFLLASGQAASAPRAVEMVRAARPGSLQTQAQVMFVSIFEQYLQHLR